MATYVNHKIQDIIGELKDTEKMVSLYENAEDPVAEVMAYQFRRRKAKLMKELLSELALSGASFKSTGRTIQRLTSYLEALDEEDATSKELKSNLAEVEKLMAV